MQHVIVALLSAFFDSEVEGPAPHQILNPTYQELGEYQGQQDLRCVYRFDKSSSWILSQIKKQTLSITESWYSMVLLAINEERWIIRYKVAKWPRSVSLKKWHTARTSFCGGVNKALNGRGIWQLEEREAQAFAQPKYSAKGCNKKYFLSSICIIYIYIYYTRNHTYISYSI